MEVGSQKLGVGRLKTGNCRLGMGVGSPESVDRTEGWRLETGVGSWKSGVREQKTVY